MVIVLYFTNQGYSLNMDPSPFPYFGNVGPHMATLSLLVLMIDLLVWLFSTSLVSNIQVFSPQVYNSPQP